MVLVLVKVIFYLRDPKADKLTCDIFADFITYILSRLYCLMQFDSFPSNLFILKNADEKTNEPFDTSNNRSP